MNPYQNNNPYVNNGYPQRRPKANGDGLATAGMVLGILSIVTAMTFTIYPAFVFGSIAIVLALLSKGHAPKLASKAKISIICATAGIVFNSSVCVTTVQAVREHPELLDEALDNFEKQYGVSYGELMNMMLNGEEVPVNVNIE